MTSKKVLRSGAVYLFEMSSSGDESSWAQVAKLKANDGRHHRRAFGDDHFGKCVAISDGTIVIGSPYGDDDKGLVLVPYTSSRRALPTTRARGRKWQNSKPMMEQICIFSVVPLQSAMVPSSSERTMTTIKVLILVPCTSSRRALPTTRARGRKWQNSPPTMEQRMIFSVRPLQSAMVPSSSERIR